MMFNKTIAIVLILLAAVAIATAEEHLYLYRGSAPSEAQIQVLQVAVAGYSPDGMILVTNDVLGQRLQASHPQVVDLGVWEEGTARFIIAARDLTASIKPLYRAQGWALVDDAAALGRERIHGVALQHGRPFIPKERPAPVPQTKPNRYLPGLGAILNGITSGELLGRVNNLVNYQTRYSPTASGHQAAEDAADTLAGWGYDVTRWRYISTGITDITTDGDSIWISSTQEAFSPLGCAFHSSDGGLTFHESDVPSEYISRTNFRIASEGSNVILSQYGSIQVSHDSGSSWVNTAPFGGIKYKGIYLDGNEAWCVTETGKLYHSTDTGESWQDMNFPGGYGCNDVVVSSNTIIVVGSFGIYISPDSGQTWNHAYTTLGRNILRVRIYDGHIWAVGGNGLVAHSTEGFNQFQTINLGERIFNSIAFYNNKGIICGEAGALFISLDSGDTWQEINLDSESTLFAAGFTSTGLGLIGGSSGTLKVSDSSLNNWQTTIDRFDPNDLAVWTNVIAEKQGVTRPGEVILTTAHIDSTVGVEYDPWTYAPGADDNATGSSTVLTLANAFRNYTVNRTMRFILFTGEEQFTIGSNRYANWSQAQGEDIQAVYNLDMTGYAAGAIKQDLIANQQSTWLSDYAVSCAHQYVPGYAANSITDPLFVFSDHSPFWGLGIPALCSIESWDVRGDNPYYHTPQDLPEWLNGEQMLGACRVAGATIGELAQPGDSPLPSTLADLKVYPNPFRPSAGQQIVTFANVPVGSKVEIYDVAGNRVACLAYADGYRITWAGRNDVGNRLATGVYLYKVSAPGGGIKTGKLAIIN